MAYSSTSARKSITAFVAALRAFSALADLRQNSSASVLRPISEHPEGRTVLPFYISTTFRACLSASRVCLLVLPFDPSDLDVFLIERCFGRRECFAQARVRSLWYSRRLVGQAHDRFTSKARFLWTSAVYHASCDHTHAPLSRAPRSAAWSTLLAVPESQVHTLQHLAWGILQLITSASSAPGSPSWTAQAAQCTWRLSSRASRPNLIATSVLLPINTPVLAEHSRYRTKRDPKCSQVA